MHVEAHVQSTCDTQTCDTGHVEDDIRSILNNLPGNLSLDITMEILKPLIKQIKIRLFFQVFNGRDAL